MPAVKMRIALEAKKLLCFFFKQPRFGAITRGCKGYPKKSMSLLNSARQEVVYLICALIWHVRAVVYLSAMLSVSGKLLNMYHWSLRPLFWFCFK